jgi:hypothetical protein
MDCRLMRKDIDMRKLRPTLALFVLAGALLPGVTAGAPAAVADDWYRDPCFNATQEHHVMSYAENEMEPAAQGQRIRYGKPNEASEQKYILNWSEQKTASIVVEGSVGFNLFVDLTGKAGYTNTVQTTVGGSSEWIVKTDPGEFVTMTPYTFWEFRKIITTWNSPGGGVCAISATVARIPVSWGVCELHDNRTLAQDCPTPFTRQPGRGPSTGGTNPPTPPGPQPVTDVRQVPDGTVLATTDTKRIYKMVGGAPVWQSTCDNNICQPQSRPTTQGVINAGPATPRNGATAIDQRGQIYVFVGGAPLWQDTCAAPVNCGTPVKVSNWSIDARDHMNRLPADGNLVQGKIGNTDLPVAATVGGALIPFANPQEVIDSGHGADWHQRVTAISGNSYNALGFDPADGTLIQGAANGVSTPVAMIVGNAIVPFANPQEVIDVGYGANWASKVRGIPARVFNARARVPADNTLIQGTGGGNSTPVAVMVGGARINFASPQEVIDTGHGTDWASKVRAIPARAFSELHADTPMDSTLVQGTGGTPVAKIVGGARVNFASPQEVMDSGFGADWRNHVRAIPGRAFNLIRTRMTDGVLLKKAGHDGIGVLVGGAWVPFWTMAELVEAGYKDAPVHMIPGRVLDALPRSIGDGVLVKKPGHDGIGVVVGGAWVPFWTMAELVEAGYKDAPVHMIPGRVLDALPRSIGDGALIKAPDSPTVWKITAGKKVATQGPGTVRTVPARVVNGIPTA